MKRERNAFKAGLFIVVSIVLIVGVIVLIRGEGTGPTQVRTVSFALADDLSGLAVGDEIRIAGVKVGVVREIRFEGLESSDARVLVKFSLPASYALHEDAQIAVQSALTGSPNLNLTSLGTGKPIADNTLLAGIPDAKATLFAALRRAAPRIEAIAASLQTSTIPKVNDTVDAFHKTADSATAKIGPVGDRATEALAQVRDLIGDTKTDFRGTVKNLNDATASVRDKLPTLLDKVTGVIDKVDGAVINAKVTLEDIQKSAANARELTGAARSVIVDNRGKLDTMVKSLKATSDNLKATSVEVRHSPWRLLYKPGPDEISNLNIYDSARQFAEGAANLSDAATALRDSMKDPDVDKAQIKKLADNLDESFKNFHKAEAKLWTSVKE